MSHTLFLVICCLHLVNSALDPNASASLFPNLTAFHDFIINLNNATTESSTSLPPATNHEATTASVTDDATTPADTHEHPTTPTRATSTLSTTTIDDDDQTSITSPEDPASTNENISTTISEISESRSTATTDSITTSTQLNFTVSGVESVSTKSPDSHSGSASADDGTNVFSTVTSLVITNSEVDLVSSTVNSISDSSSSQNTESTSEDFQMTTTTTSESIFSSTQETSASSDTGSTLEDSLATSTAASTTSSLLDNSPSSSASPVGVTVGATTTVTLPSSASVHPQTNPIVSTTADKTSVSSANRVSTASEEEVSSVSVQPPILVNPISSMVIDLGTVFEFPIPDDTFYDITDGSTRNLNVTVTTVANDPLLPDFWLQFNQETQTLHGLPLTDDDVQKLVNFAITATNSAGASTRHTFEIEIDQTSIEDVSHEFQATFAIRHQNVEISRTYLISLIRRLTDYFKDDDADSLSIISISEGSVILNWTNNTISKGQCMNDTLTELYSLLYTDGRVNPSFRVAMEPDFPVSDVGFSYRGICLEYEASTAPSTDDEDDSIVLLLAILIPLLLVALLIFLCACYLFGFFRCCDPQNGKYHPDEELFVDRKPVILPDEFATQPSEKSRKYPVIVPSDLGHTTYENLAFEAELSEAPSLKKSTSSVSSSKADSLLDESSFPSTSSSVDVPTPEYKVPPAYLSPVSTSSA
ncbi:hypothetical protein CAPTEDRAFT_198354 [Capitella teleta]|uniref:Dystroglycan 1 n=1 Tax=Capitella teleta TaxID=283909 RepID=R7UAL0_CAPTE|nr:hypothetical protein CAPTEDRAFT_198354 [Capitella teleta]|eukprot:ELU03166.1 hypothetical protein CAPTEDRAFT_198354 [Capitella teleta]